MAVSMSQIGNDWGYTEYVTWVSKPDIFFVLNYLNMTLLTALAVILMSLLFAFAKELNRLAAISGLVFIPIYGVLNIISYSIQIAIVPRLASLALSAEPPTIFLVFELIQANQNSFIGFVNGMAYAIVGIPSILYGYILIQNRKPLSGWFLLLNGIACIIGIIGYMLKNPALSSGSVIGGLLFLFSLGGMMWEFRDAAAYKG